MDIVGKKTLRSLLSDKVKQHKEKTFILFEDANEQQFGKTFQEFYRDVNQLSNAFLNLGVQKGDHVILHLPNTIEFLTIWFALANIGAIMVPTNILSTSDEMKYMINHSGAIVLVTEMEYLEKFKQIKEELPTLQKTIITRSKHQFDDVLHFHEFLASGTESTENFPEIRNEDVVAMLYTSGTTSNPKGVQVTHANYIFAGELLSKSINLTENDRSFIVLPLFHGNAQYYSTMSALVVGGSIALTEKFSASRYFKQAKRLGGTVGSLFAAPIRMILSKEYDSTDKENPIRLILFAQSIAEHQVKSFEEKYNLDLIQIYGMTETIGIPLINPINDIRKNMSIGKPSIGYEVKLLDENGLEVAEGEIGQIAVKGFRGRTLMKGYFKNEEATQQTFKEDWLLTGDNARIGEDGYFYFVDRLKDMIKRSGENVAANEVESVLVEHVAVFEAAVIGIPDHMRDEAIKAFVILNKGVQATENELIEHCRKRLAKFKVPDAIEFVDEFPRTAVGKIKKHILRNPTSIEKKEGIV